MANVKNDEAAKHAKEQVKESSKQGGSQNNTRDEMLKDKYAELRIASAQIKQLQQQVEAVEEKRQELGTAVSSLDELKNAQKNAAMLAPITEGIFASATLGNSDELVVNVGGNVCVRKTVEEAKGMLKEKLQEISGYQESMLEELNRLTDHAAALESQLGQMLQEEE